MAIWWAVNLVILLVLPVVVILLRGVLKEAKVIKKTIDDIHGVGGAMVADLDAVGQLATTQSLVAQTKAGLTRYGAALDDIL